MANNLNSVSPSTFAPTSLSGTTGNTMKGKQRIGSKQMSKSGAAHGKMKPKTNAAMNKAKC